MLIERIGLHNDLGNGGSYYVSLIIQITIYIFKNVLKPQITDEDFEKKNLSFKKYLSVEKIVLSIFKSEFWNSVPIFY